MATDGGAAFRGQWQDSEGTRLQIEGASLTDDMGVTVALAFPGPRTCLLQAGRESFEGSLSADGRELLWSDGAVWLRQGSGGAVESAATTAARPTLALEEVLALQSELQAALEEPGFHARLREVEAAHGKAHANYSPAHSALFEEAQGPVLQRFGFAPGRKGLMDMLEVGAAFNGNAEYCRRRLRLQTLLGLVPSEGEEAPTVKTMQVKVRHYFDNAEQWVTVPQDATFRALKEALSELLGSEDVLRRGHLVRKEAGIYSAYPDGDAVGSLRCVSFVGAALTVRDDEEAAAWREKLRDKTADPQSAKAQNKGYSKRTWKDVRPGDADQARAPPHGPCYLVGSWDDWAGRKEMTWDSAAYRCLVTVRCGEEGDNFQILAGSKSFDKRIYPSYDGANPLMLHQVKGPDDRGHDLNWTIVEPVTGSRYEVVLSCPKGKAMSMAWSKELRR